LMKSMKKAKKKKEGVQVNERKRVLGDNNDNNNNFDNFLFMVYLKSEKVQCCYLLMNYVT